jgi:LPS export ABC transporter permease LptG
VLLSLGGEETGGVGRLIVAQRGELVLEGSRLWLELTRSTVHEVDPADPSRYRVNRNERQRILFAGDIWRDPKARISYEKGLRAQSLAELVQTVRLMREDPNRSRYRLAWVEIHKKFSIPFACFAFAFLGIPLAEASRRGGRGSSFALSLAIIIGYYVLISSGETWAENGSLPPALAMWLPNLLLLGLGVVAWRRFRRPSAGSAPFSGRLAFLRRRGAPETDAERPAFLSGMLRFPAILDRYVLSRFVGALVLVLLSILLLAAIVDYADQVDEILRNRPSGAVVAGYYRSFLLAIAVQLSPFAFLIAALVSLGALSRNNEDTAFKASGVSLYRLGAPILVASALAAGVVFALQEYVLPQVAQRQARYRNQIRGRPVDYGLRTPAERNWYFASDGRIWHREESDPDRGILVEPTVLTFDRAFDLMRRDTAREASWDGRSWIFRQGWTRVFGDAGDAGYRSYLEDRISGDPPRAFVRERREPDEMRFRELQRHSRRLRRTGYPTARLETALQQKLSRPALVPLMALIALPFAFRLGRRGALAGIGIGLLLGMALLVASEFFSKLGEVGALPAAFAAWTPNVLFATAACFLLLRLRT